MQHMYTAWMEPLREGYITNEYFQEKTQKQHSYRWE